MTEDTKLILEIIVPIIILLIIFCVMCWNKAITIVIIVGFIITAAITLIAQIPAAKDKIEISELGRNLSMYDNVDFNIDNSAKIEELKAKIQNGTYNVDAKLTAQSILNNIKEGR